MRGYLAVIMPMVLVCVVFVGFWNSTWLGHNPPLGFTVTQEYSDSFRAGRAVVKVTIGDEPLYGLEAVIGLTTDSLSFLEVRPRYFGKYLNCPRVGPRQFICEFKAPAETAFPAGSQIEILMSSEGPLQVSLLEGSAREFTAFKKVGGTNMEDSVSSEAYRVVGAAGAGGLIALAMFLSTWLRRRKW